MTHHVQNTTYFALHWISTLTLPPFCTPDASVTFELRRGQDRSAGKCWSHTIKDVTPGVRLFAEVSCWLVCVLHAALLIDSLRVVTLYLLHNTFLQANHLSLASVPVTVSWRLLSPFLSLSTTPSFPTNNPPIASRFLGRYGAAGPKRVLPTSVDDLPDFASSFPEIFSASHWVKSSDQQVLDLMMMITQLTRFKPAVQTSGQPESGSSPSPAGPAVSHATPTEHYFGSSSHSKALEEVVLWIATSAARQVECQYIFAIIFVAHHDCCYFAGAVTHVRMHQFKEHVPTYQSSVACICTNQSDASIFIHQNHCHEVKKRVTQRKLNFLSVQSTFVFISLKFCFPRSA